MLQVNGLSIKDSINAFQWQDNSDVIPIKNFLNLILTLNDFKLSR